MSRMAPDDVAGLLDTPGNVRVFGDAPFISPKLEWCIVTPALPESIWRVGQQEKPCLDRCPINRAECGQHIQHTLSCIGYWSIIKREHELGVFCGNCSSNILSNRNIRAACYKQS